MTASVIYLRHVLTPHKRRVEHVQPCSVSSLAPDWQRPYIALHNGRAILRRDWGRILQHGETLAFIDVQAIPQDGGSGESNPLAFIAMLVVMYFTAGAGAGWLTAYGGGTVTAGALVGATWVNMAAQFVGMMLVSALLPPPTPPTPQQAASLASPSPTYNLQAQGNVARLEAAIPEHFGRLRAFLDFAAQPYTEYAGNEQYLYQLLCLGRGEYAIEQVLLEDTPITSFDEIQIEICQPGVRPSLFPSNVVQAVEISGQTLACVTATYTQTGTDLIVTQVGHGLSVGRGVRLVITSGTATSGDYEITTTTADTFTVTAPTTTTSGGVTVSPWIGPVVAVPSGETANTLGIDLVAPRGVYYVDQTTGEMSSVSMTMLAQVRTIDDNGAPTSGWGDLTTKTLEGATTTPQRVSYRLSVSTNRYDVRVCRTDVEQTAPGWAHNLVWAGLRAWLPDVNDYGDVTLIAMRMRASNNLSMQGSRKINCIATRKLPTWNGNAWTAPEATRSIAWAAAYIAKQIGLEDTQIDLTELARLNLTWVERSDFFDARFDNTLTAWEALTKVLQPGRTKAYMQSGVLRVARDEARALPVALYSMRNIARGSLSIDYLMPNGDSADSVRVRYYDEAVWALRPVLAALPDSPALNPATVELFGVTNRDQAWREGMYLAACTRYRRKLIKFTTEMEGFLPSFGDLILINHDMPAWGQHSEVTAWDSNTRTLTLSEPLVWTSGSVAHYIGLRRRDGGLAGPFEALPGTDEYHVVITETPDESPYVGSDAERTHCLFGLGETWRQPARVIGVRPRGLHQVEIEAINEDANVHLADTSSTMPSINYSQLNVRNTAPSVLGLICRASPSDPNVAMLSWQPSPGAERYLIEQSADGQNWTRSGETSAAHYTVAARYGSATIFRLAAIGLTRGPWITVSFGASGDYMWAPAESPMWTPSGDPIWTT